MHAPRDSPLMSALADDPDAAAAGPAQAPKLAQFSPEVEALAGVYDLLAALLANVVSLGGGKPPRIPPYPRPVTASQLAAERAERDAARRQHEELVRRLIPGGDRG